MTKFTSIAAAVALSALFAGNAMAQMPVSGEGPLFQNEAKAASTLSRDAVRSEAVANRPASGVFDGTAVAQGNSSLTREAVRQQAIANPPSSGVFNESAVAQGNSGLTRAAVRQQAIATPPASGVFDGGTVAQQHRGVQTQAAGE